MEPWMWVVAVVLLFIVIPALTKTMRPKATEPPALRPDTLPAEAAAEIDALIANDQKIAAIKHYRELTGLGLREAKDAVESWQPGTTWTSGAPASVSRPASGLSSEARAEIDALIAAGQKITAIKRYREETGDGLREAKDAIEGWTH